MIHLTFEGFASRGGLALLSLPFYEFGNRWLAKVALPFFVLPPHQFGGVLDPLGCSCFWKMVWPGMKSVATPGERGNGTWSPQCGQRAQVIPINLLSGDVLQRINVFIGFLSLCCKKQDAIPGHRRLLKECHISSSSLVWCCSPVLRCRWCVKHCCSSLSAATQPLMQCRLVTGTGKLISDTIPAFVCSQILPSEHLKHLPGSGFGNVISVDT